MQIYRRLLRYLRPYFFPPFVVAVLCMLLYSATEGALPFLIERVVDDIFTEKKLEALRILPVALVLLFLLRGVVGFGHRYLIEYVGQRIVEDLRNELNRRIQSFPLSFFHRHPTGTILSRMTSDVILVRNALTETAASLMRDSTSLVVLVCVAFLKDWFLALLAFLVFPVALLPIIELSRKVRRLSRKSQAYLGQLTALLQETIQGSRVVKAFGMEEYEAHRFAQENRRLFRLYMRAGRARAFVQPMVEVVAAAGLGAVVWYGGRGVIAGERTQGAFMAFLTALFLLYKPFKRLTATNNTLQQGAAGAERLFELLDAKAEVQEQPGALELKKVRQGIRFHQVGFRYEKEWVLRGVNLEIRAGEVVALVGPSGSGKSTLADLIPRFYDVEEGGITIDGVDIRHYTLKSLRSQIALVTQFTFLFNDTVRNNIAYGDPTQPMERIIEAAKAAHAHEFILSLPQGYDTVVGELGVKLSGGQRQRLAIARALLKNAPILILDEATSSLDNESERLVQDAMEHLMQGRTVLVIAHRLSTVSRADRIVVLSQGRVIEMGRHEELLAQNTEYRRLYELQFADVPLH